MTWPPRTILVVSLAMLLIILLVAVTILPWYRQLPLSRGGRLLVVASVIIGLLILRACVVFLVPVYWD